MSNNNTAGVTKDMGGDELSLKDLVLKIGQWYKLILKKWKQILLTSILCGAVGLIYSVVNKPIYKAHLSFSLEDAKSSGGLGSYSGLASQFGLDVGGGSGGVFYGDNLMELMKSRSMVEKTLLTKVNIHGKEQTLAEYYIQFNGYRDKWQNKPQLANLHFPPDLSRSKFSITQDSLLGLFYKSLLLNNLSVTKTDKKLSIIVLDVNAKDELFSKYFAEILADQVSSFYIETKTKKAQQNVNILQHQTDSVKKELFYAINGVAQSIDVNPNANPNRQVLRAPSQHKQVDVQVNSGMLIELEKQLEIAQVSLRNETPLIQVIDKPILPLDIDHVGKIKGTAIGLIIGFILGVVVISVRKLFQSLMA